MKLSVGSRTYTSLQHQFGEMFKGAKLSFGRMLLKSTLQQLNCVTIQFPLVCANCNPDNLIYLGKKKTSGRQSSSYYSLVQSSLKCVVENWENLDYAQTYVAGFIVESSLGTDFIELPDREIGCS